MNPISKKVLSAVTATGASESIDTWGHPYLTMVVTASGVTNGATIELQGSADGTNWASLASNSVSADGTTQNTVTAVMNYIRANITSYTDGTYSVYLLASGYAGRK